ncbi:MAG: glycosyltransferase family 39 protein [Acidobacteriota bacterium]
MAKPRPVALVLTAAACFAACSFGIARRGLFETSEGRYASLAAAMVRSGDWIVPRLNGVKRFEKPPLSMWCMASSIRILGESEGALRLPGAIAALCAAGAAYQLAGGEGAGLLAMMLVSAAPLFFGLSKSLTTDIYLTSFTALALMCGAAAIERPERRSKLHLLAAVMGGLGFLTKGPVIFVVALAPMLLEIVVGRHLSDLRSLFHWKCFLVFLAIAAPWFVVVSMKEQGLLSWFVRERTVRVLVTAKDMHPGPPYYYVPVFLLGFLPASLFLCAAPRRVARALGREGPRVERLLAYAVLVTLGTFTLSASKLATYVLPAVVPAVALAIRFLPDLGRASFAAAAAVFAALPLLARAAAPIVNARKYDGNLPASVIAYLGAAAALAVAGGTIAVLLRFRDRRAPALVTLAITQGLTLAIVMASLTSAEGAFGSGREIALETGALSRGGRVVLCYRAFVRSIPYYTGQNAHIVDWYKSDRISPEEWDEVSVGTAEDMRRILAREKAVLLCESKDEDRLAAEVAPVGPMRKVKVVGRYALFLHDPRPTTP